MYLGPVLFVRAGTLISLMTLLPAGFVNSGWPHAAPPHGGGIGLNFWHAF
jgi:hypothetical protein